MAAGDLDPNETALPVLPLEAPTDPSRIAPVTALDYGAALAEPLTPLDGRSAVAESQSDSRRRFVVGTLVYTTGGLVVLFFWLLFGDFALSIRDRSVGPLMQLMLSGFKADNFTMAVLLSMIPTSITLVLSPVISYRSDRFRSRWGRRIPFLLIPTPVAALAMVGLAFCPQLARALEAATGHAVSQKAALLTTFSVFWTAFEIAAVVSASVFGGLINDVVPRPVLGRFYAMFRAVSLIDGMIFNWFILGHAESHFTIICGWIAAVYGVGFVLMCLMVKEGDYPAEPAVPHEEPAGGFVAGARVYCRECFSHPHYLWIFAAFTLTALAANPINSWSIVYSKQIGLGMDKWDSAGAGFGAYRLGYGGILTLTYLFSLTLAYPIGILVDRFHPLRVAMASMLLYAMSCFVGWYLIRDAASFGWAALAHGVLSGCYFTATAALAQVLLPRTRFAQFASAGVVVTQLATLVYTPILGRVLDWTHSDYRLTFLLSGLFSTASLLLLIHVYRRFMAMGGPGGYVAPFDNGAARGFEVVPRH